MQCLPVPHFIDKLSQALNLQIFNPLSLSSLLALSQPSALGRQSLKYFVLFVLHAVKCTLLSTHWLGNSRLGILINSKIIFLLD